MRISKSICASLLFGVALMAAWPATAGQTVFVLAAQHHSATTASFFLGAPGGSPCLPTNVVVEPCRDWYGAAPDGAGSVMEWPAGRDQYGLEYLQIGRYRYYE